MRSDTATVIITIFTIYKMYTTYTTYTVHKNEPHILNSASVSLYRYTPLMSEDNFVDKEYYLRLNNVTKIIYEQR